MPLTFWNRGLEAERPAYPRDFRRLLRLSWKAKRKEQSAKKAKREGQRAKRKTEEFFSHGFPRVFLRLPAPCSLLHAIL